MNQPRASAATEGVHPERTPSEATALLVELGRAVKARSFYAPGEPEVRLLLARAWRSLHANLLRFGQLDVTADGAGLCVPSLGLRVPSVQLGGLAQRLAERRVATLRFDAALDSEGLAQLVDWLAADAGDAPDATAFCAGLDAAGVRGLALNPTDARAPAPLPRERGAQPALAPAPALAGTPAVEPTAAGVAAVALELASAGAAPVALEPAPAAAAPVALEPAPGGTAPVAFEGAPPELPGPTLEPAIERAYEWPLAPAFEPPTIELALPTAREASAEPAREPAAVIPLELVDDTSAEPETDPAPALDAGDADSGELRFDADASPAFADSDATPASAPTPRVGIEDTDTEAVEAGASGVSLEDGEDGRPTELDELLRELAACEDDFQYHDMARRAEALAAALADEGHVELGNRALTLFARHAGDDGKRSPLQRDAAADHLQRLASGARLADLIDRACSSGSDASLAATQVLMRLGSRVVPTLFRAAERETEPNRRGQLHGILIAMGDVALPEVLRAMESGEPGAVRAAVRLAGEMQSPRAVEPLAGLLEGDVVALRQEAAKALVRIGDGRAIDALVRALESPVEGVPNLASYCLGAAGSARAADALAAALRRSLQRRQFAFAIELVRALGRLGRPEPVRELAALSRRGGLRNRRALRELRVAAVAALGRLPGDEAVAALGEAAGSRDAHVRRAAESALERRASAAAR